MSTKKFALDFRDKRIYIGSSVNYKNSVYFVEDIKYLSWSTSQYLTLREKKNKNKIIDYILPCDVKIHYLRET